MIIARSVCHGMSKMTTTDAGDMMVCFGVLSLPWTNGTT